jgi:hypothetical protein
LHADDGGKISSLLHLDGHLLTVAEMLDLVALHHKYAL